MAPNVSTVNSVDLTFNYMSNTNECMLIAELIYYN